MEQVMPAVLSEITAEIEARRSAYRERARGAYTDLVAKLAAQDAEGVAAAEVEQIVTAAGQTLANLNADVKRIIDRREAIQVYACKTEAEEDLREAERQLTDLEAEKKRYLEEFPRRLRAAKNLLESARSNFNQVQTAGAVLMKTAPPEWRAEIDATREALRAEELRLQNAIPQLRQQIIGARREYESQISGRGRHDHISVVETLGEEPRRYGETHIEARVNGEMWRVRSDAITEAIFTGIPEADRDAYAHQAVERARVARTEQYTREARAPLTKLEAQLAEAERQLRELPAKRAALAEQIERELTTV